jgi:hypothetical protein
MRALNIVLRMAADVEGWVAFVQGFDAAFTNGVASAQPDPTPAAGTAMEQTVKVLDMNSPLDPKPWNLATQ